MAAHQAPLSLGFSRQEHWSGLPFPSPMHESEKWKWSPSVVSNSSSKGKKMKCHGVILNRTASGIWEIPLTYPGLLWTPRDSPDSLKQKGHILKLCSSITTFQLSTQYNSSQGELKYLEVCKPALKKKRTSARFCETSFQLFLHNSNGETTFPLISLTRGNLGTA